MILKTFGCSHTYGSELRNSTETSWPILLSKKINMPVKNFSRPRSSNEEIIHTATINAPSVEKSLIIFLKTACNRVYWPLDTTYNSFNVNNNDILSIYKLGNKTIKYWFKYHYNENTVKTYHEFLYESCKELLELRGHTVYMFDYTDMRRVCENLPRGPKGHFLEEAQEVWTKYLMKKILR